MKTPKQKSIDELYQTLEGVKQEGQGITDNYWVNKAKAKCYQCGVTRDEVEKIFNQYKNDKTNS